MQDRLSDAPSGFVYGYADSNCQGERLSHSIFAPNETRGDSSTGVIFPAAYIFELDTGGVAQVFRAGAEHTGQVYQKAGNGPCTAYTREPSTHYYLRGSNVPLTEFAEMTAGLL